MNDTLEDPREPLLRYTVRCFLVFSLIGNSTALYVQLEIGWRDGMLLGYLLTPIFLGLIFFEKTLSTDARAWIYQLSLTTFFVGTLLSVGFLSAYHGFAVFLPTAAVVFLGFRAAIFQSFLCISGYLLMLIVVGGVETPVQIDYEELTTNTTHKIYYASIYAIVSMGTILLFYAYVKTLKQVAETNKSLVEYNSALIEGIADAPDMFALWDQEDRLIFSNNEMTNRSTEKGIPSNLGISYAEWLRNMLDKEVLNLEDDSSENWRRQRVKELRTDGLERTYSLTNGDWRSVRHSVTPGGLVATFATDITQVKTAERRLKFIVDSISERVLTLTENGVITFANAGVSQSFGFTNEQLIGMRFDQLVASVTNSELDRLLGSYSEENMEPEFRISNATAVNRNGEFFNVGVRLGLAKHAQESVIIVVLQDYSLLDTGEARVHAMFDAIRQIDIGILLVDGSGRVYFSNEEMESIFNPGVFEVGESFQDAISLLSSTGLIESVDGAPDSTTESAWRLKGSSPVVKSVLLSDGRYIRLVGQPISNGAQMWICSDDTDTRVKDMQLQQAAKLASLGEMAAGIAHEINQPLNVIRLAANNVLRTLNIENLEVDRVAKKLHRINDQTERAEFIIKQLRDYGRDAKEQDVASNIADCVMNVKSMVGEQLRLDGIELHVKVDSESSSVLIHPTKLEQVLVALVNNARDACISSGDQKNSKPAISIRVAKINREEVVIDVADTGGGILSEYVDKVFEPFFTTKGIGEGTGLGLSVSYNIIRDAGGVLSCHNSREGANFRILMPEVQCDLLPT